MRRYGQSWVLSRYSSRLRISLSNNNTKVAPWTVLCAMTRRSALCMSVSPISEILHKAVANSWDGLASNTGLLGSKGYTPLKELRCKVVSVSSVALSAWGVAKRSESKRIDPGKSMSSWLAYRKGKRGKEQIGRAHV